MMQYATATTTTNKRGASAPHNFYMKGGLYKIKKGKEDTWRTWCAYLSNQARDEAIETLKLEKATIEIFSMFAIDGRYYTVGVGDMKERSYDPLSVRHREVIDECLERLDPVEVLYTLSTDHT